MILSGHPSWAALPSHSSAQNHQFRFIEHVFHGWIAEVVEELYTIHSQDGLQLIGRSPLASFWVVRPDLLHQTIPGNQHVHLLQKQIPPRLPLLGLVLKSAKLFSMLFMPAKLPS